jgi:hypothetical protein
VLRETGTVDLHPKGHFCVVLLIRLVNVNRLMDSVVVYFVSYGFCILFLVIAPNFYFQNTKLRLAYCIANVCACVEALSAVITYRSYTL